MTFTVEVTVLSSTPPTTVELLLVWGEPLPVVVPMSRSVDPRSGKAQAQVYTATVPLPSGGENGYFSWSVKAEVPGAASSQLRFPEGTAEQTVVVVARRGGGIDGGTYLC